MQHEPTNRGTKVNIGTKLAVESLRNRLVNYIQGAIVSLSTDEEWIYEDSVFLLDNAYAVSDEDLLTHESELANFAVDLIEEYVSVMDEQLEEDLDTGTETHIPVGKPHLTIVRT